MNEYLIFRLYAPLCSWGDIAVGELRPSYTHPSKSALTGLLAAALGLKRDEEEKIKNLAFNYGFAVLVDSFGKPLLDYHTAQVPPGKEKHSTRKDELKFMAKHELKTILSRRAYRMDACYTIIVRKNEHGLWGLEEITERLKYPVFTPYLGRKSCPSALPLEPQVIGAETVINALKEAVFKIDVSAEETRLLLGTKKKDLFFEECFCPEFAGCVDIYIRRDIPLSRKRWQFDTRKEYHTVIGG